MKRKTVAITLGIILGLSPAFAACGSTTSSSGSSVTSASSASEESDTIYGEIASVDGDTITINVGTKSDDSEELTLTGDTQEITVTDDTTITREMGGAPGDQGSAPGSSDSGSSVSSGSDSSSDSSSGQPPEMPSDTSSGSSSDSSTGQPPEMPSDTSSDSGNSVSSGSDSSSDSSSGQPPEMPSGTSQSGSAPSGSSQGGPSEDLTVDDLAEGDSISVTLNDDGSAATITVMGGGQGGSAGGQSSGVDSYDAANTISENSTLSDQTIESTGTDENAILVDSGATATLKNLTITRSSDDSTGGDNSSFYGVGASVLTTDGTTYLSDSSITSDAKGGAGVFSYGDGTTYVADTTISTSEDTSGGIHVAGGGTLYAWNLSVTTEGESSAAIRSDRGGGTMVVDGGTYTSNGTGSPAVYSTADISVNNATLTANSSEAICIEGQNTIRLFDCDLTGNMSDSDQNDCTWNVILYQSMSGDSEEGNSDFEMDGGTLTAKNGGMFYTTNTESTFVLKDVDITYADENDFFLKCTGNSNQRGWGETGSNGADSTFTAISQDCEGDIIWDSISQLDFYLTDGSTLKGAVVDDESNAGDGGDGYCSVYVDSSSTWTVTGDSTVTNLYSEGKIVDESGKTVTIKGTDGTVYVDGDSDVTITVTKYSDSVDTSGAGTISSWSDYSTEEPSELTSEA